MNFTAQDKTRSLRPDGIGLRKFCCRAARAKRTRGGKNGRTWKARGKHGISWHPVPAIRIRQFVPPRTLTSANICIRKSCANICLVARQHLPSRKLSWPPPNLVRPDGSAVQPIRDAGRNASAATRVDQLRFPRRFCKSFRERVSLPEGEERGKSSRKRVRFWKNEVRGEGY